MIQIDFEVKKLEFIIPAQTSRGAYTEKTVHLIKLQDGEKIAVGEASPLPDLSVDGTLNIGEKIQDIRQKLDQNITLEKQLPEMTDFPSLQFAIECALLQLKHKNGWLFENDFTLGKTGIEINGLVWMNDAQNMHSIALKKVTEGFRCIKFKVGANTHDEECRLLEKLRKKCNAFQLEIRLDANGAFCTDDALERLRDFARFEIHSLEQPVKAGQWEVMEEICAKSPIDIALDEELIGIDEKNQGMPLLRSIKPAYLILKPTLLGGFTRCDHWISLAKTLNIGWWATSALESNIGLSHIAQWIGDKNNSLPQGLGTGGLYKKNLQGQVALLGNKLWFEG